MRRRLFNLAAAVSLVLCVATVALWIFSLRSGEVMRRAEMDASTNVFRTDLISIAQGQLTWSRSVKDVVPYAVPAGTRFYFYESRRPRPPRPHFGRDEDGVRLLAREALRGAGYRVVEASHGVEALVRARQHHGPIHLVVTDVIMPHMGGPELVQRLNEMFPDVKTIYMSGYTDSTVVHEGVLSRSVAFLDKPFTGEELTREVRRVLDERPGTGQTAPPGSAGP